MSALKLARWSADTLPVHHPHANARRLVRARTREQRLHHQATARDAVRDRPGQLLPEFIHQHHATRERKCRQRRLLGRVPNPSSITSKQSVRTGLELTSVDQQIASELARMRLSLRESCCPACCCDLPPP